MNCNITLFVLRRSRLMISSSIYETDGSFLQPFLSIVRSVVGSCVPTRLVRRLEQNVILLPESSKVFFLIAISVTGRPPFLPLMLLQIQSSSAWGRLQVSLFLYDFSSPFHYLVAQVISRLCSFPLRWYLTTRDWLDQTVVTVNGSHCIRVCRMEYLFYIPRLGR